jgi:hypothetical protein
MQRFAVPVPKHVPESGQPDFTPTFTPPDLSMMFTALQAANNMFRLKIS